MGFLRNSRSAVLVSGLLVALGGGVHAQKMYHPGATDAEIKIGNIMPCKERESSPRPPSTTGSPNG
jgi:hypothetical protein